jgi:L-alanine-DL-glutamate epimerase-like enolase superfamily enzyme
MKMRLHPVELPLRHTFTIAHGSRDVQPSLIVELAEGTYHGYGEGCPLDYYGFTVESMVAALESARRRIETSRWTEPTQLWEAMLPRLGDNRFALCALDQAAHDLWGKRLGQPVYRLWGLEIDSVPVTDYTIGIDTVQKMVAKLRELPDWPIYKIKLGTPQDLQIVAELRRHTDAVFRVDANTAWTADEAIRNAAELVQLGVEFIEQPLPRDAWELMRRVFRESPLPVIADESCQREEDVERCADCFHGINIKLTKCGGLTPARKMIERARQLGLKVMVGCMTESTVGCSAIAQLLPLLDYVDMDGPMLIARDVATGIRLDHGRVIFPEENGCGVTLL